MSDELTPRLDHVSLSVEDLDRGVAFYTPLLEALGLERVAELGPEVAGSVSCAGFGVGRKSQLWLAETGRQSPRAHLCFRARSRAEVRAFHAAGLAAGGTDNGAPGVRELYHPAYYAAFVLDPEGHNIEAVCFEPEA